MNTHNIKNEKNWSDEHIIKLAADLCFGPCTTDPDKVLAARWLIEYLALPTGKTSYARDDMEKYLKEAIEKKK